MCVGVCMCVVKVGGVLLLLFVTRLCNSVVLVLKITLDQGLCCSNSTTYMAVQL